jgi:hypothetical protein
MHELGHHVGSARETARNRSVADCEDLHLIAHDLPTHWSHVSVSPVHQSTASSGGGGARPAALHIARAEELLATLPGVVSVRIEVEAIHVLTSVEVAPKQTVRNIESALMAHLGMRVDHRKVSVATTVDVPRIRLTPSGIESIPAAPAPSAPLPVATGPVLVHDTPADVMPAVSAASPASFGASAAASQRAPQTVPTPAASPAVPPRAASLTPVRAADAVAAELSGRRYVFDDVELNRSRNGLACRVTLVRGEERFEGEAEGPASEHARLELAARATVLAIAYAEGSTSGAIALAGVRRVSAFEQELALAGVTVRQGRESVVLTGTCEIRESAEIAGVLSVLDATNRWVQVAR